MMPYAPSDDTPAAELDALRARAGELSAQRDDQRAFARALIRDLKEHVRIVSVFSHMLADGKLSPGNEHDALRFIRDAGDHMSGLADAAVHYVQLHDLDAVSKERLPLGEAVAAAKASLASLIAKRGAAIECDPLPTISGGRKEMTQLFQHLISNAISHSERPVRIHISAERAGGAWRIQVRDNGPGVAPEHQQRIFEPFQRLSEDHAHIGLGLPICTRILDLHGGAMWCESAAGEGATFAFTLPALAEDTPAQPLSPADASSLATVLLVDDREPNIRLARMFLGPPVGMNCEFLVANDGAAGLAAIDARLKEGGSIDLVLLDINMPVMDGFEMLERMRATETMRDIPVVMCSGSSYEKDKSRAADLGALGYLEKPPRFEKLRAILEDSNSVRLVVNGAAPPMLLRVA